MSGLDARGQSVRHVKFRRGYHNDDDKIAIRQQTVLEVEGEESTSSVESDTPDAKAGRLKVGLLQHQTVRHSQVRDGGQPRPQQKISAMCHRQQITLN
jgi:hypothetical protein